MTSGHRYTLLQLVAKAMAAVTILLLSSRTSPADLGGYVLGVVVASLVAAVLDLGSARTALRLCASGAPWSLVRSVLVTRWYVALVVFAVGGIATIQPALPDGGRLIALAAGTGAVMAVNGFAESILLGRGRGGLAALGNLCFNALSLLAALLASRYDGVGKELVLLSSYTLGAVSGAVVYALAVLSSQSEAHVTLDGEMDLREAHDRKLLERRNALAVGLLTLPGIVYFRLDIVLLGAMASRPEVAYYGIAYRLYEVGLILPQLLASARQPQVAATWGRDEAEPLRRGTYALITLVAAAMASGIALWLSARLPLPIGDTFLDETRWLLYLLAPGLVGASLQLATSLYIFGSPTPLSVWRPLILLSAGGILADLVALPIGFELGGINGLAAMQSVIDLGLAIVLTLVVLGRLKLAVPGICYQATALAGTALAGFVWLRPSALVATGLLVASLAVFTTRWAEFRHALTTW